MNKYIISVIVPIYNGEKYLKDCIDSIINQSFKEFEIVLVDDGSTDSSSKILDEYATLYSNIHVYHKSNEGINQTRRFGVNVAQGEWIAFSDQDDSMPLDALQNLWNRHEGTDIVIGFPDEPINKDELTLDECRENAITSKRFPPTPWAKLYKKSILTDDIFDFPRAIDGEEDMIMNIRLMFRVERAPHLVFKKVYNFRRNPISVSHKKKASLAHEELFHHVRTASMPEWARKKYLKETVFSRLNGLTSVAFYEPKSICDKNHPFLEQLKDDIRLSGYKMNLQEWLMLNVKWQWMYKMFSFLVMVKNFIKYHLGLNN